jgi:glycosyltransferase involved in cell wall biosynthesis
MSVNGPLQQSDTAKLGVVVIGRNEGSRLVQCLNSVRSIPRCVYVDSGSTDGSVQRAIDAGVLVVDLEIPPNFTAARARNAGLAKLLAQFPDVEYVQTVDADCELHDNWIAAALAALRADPGLAAVFGRLRERYPTRSIYNALCDDSWNAPLGDAPIIGGVALFRVEALREANFYSAEMIAGEEPDLSIRMRNAGWRLHRIDADMGFHDVDIMHFGQWWTRTRRTGHAYGELAFRHPKARSPAWARTVYSIVFWGFAMPLGLVIALVLAVQESRGFWLFVALGVALWLSRVVQLARRKLKSGLPMKVAVAYGALIMIGKLPQFLGLCLYHRNRMAGYASSIIEHKNPTAAD